MNNLYESVRSNLNESPGDRYHIKKYDDPIAPYGIWDTQKRKFVSRGEKDSLEKECKKRNEKYKVEKEKKNLKESDSIEDSVARINELYHNYHFGYGKGESKQKDLEIENEIKDILNSFPDGTVLCQNYMETSSGWTSMGGYSHDYATILKYTKQGDNWKSSYGLKDVDDMLLSVLHNNTDLKTEEQANRDHEELKKQNKSSHRDYAPVSTTNSDNPYWDGNRYGI